MQSDDEQLLRELGRTIVGLPPQPPQPQQPPPLTVWSKGRTA